MTLSPRVLLAGSEHRGPDSRGALGYQCVCAHSWSCRWVQDLPSQHTGACEKGEDIGDMSRIAKSTMVNNAFIFPATFLSNTVRSHLTFAQCVCFNQQNLL